MVREDSLAEASRNQIRYKGMWGPVVVGERIRAGDLIMSAGIFRASTCHRETGARATIELWGAMGVGVCGSG